MRIIRIWANSLSTGIFDDEGNFIFQKSTSISNSTWKELQEWVLEYEPYTSVSTKKLPKYLKKINELDLKGISLLKKIRSEWQRDLETNEKLQFVYRSEVLGKNISVD